jgi:hypothetical protein
MMARVSIILAVLGIASLLSAGDGKKSFHGVHGGSESTPKLDYEELYEAAVPLSNSEEGRAELERCLQAYGGRDHLAGLTSVCLTYDMQSDIFQSGPVERVVASGRRYRIEIPGQVRALDGQRAWFEIDSKPGEIEGRRYNGELFSYLTMRLPGIIEAENFEEPRFARRDGDDLGYLFFDKPDSLMLVVGVDPQTGFIRSSEGVVRSAGGYVVYINRFEDHATFDGYVFPRKFVNISMGLEVATSSLTGVEVGCEAGADVFDLESPQRARESLR